MVQFKILSGKQAGATWAARRFPVRIGRAPTADLRLDDAGVFDQHLVLQFKPAEGCVLSSEGEALTRLNGEAVQRAVVHNGDLISAGAAELQFWLAETQQSGLGLRETLTWIAIAAVFAGQLGLLYWLLN